MKEFVHYEEIIRWNPVSVKPPPSRTIYVYGPAFGRAVVHFRKDGNIYVTETGNSILRYRVTHWAEMPNHDMNWPKEITEP